MEDTLQNSTPDLLIIGYGSQARAWAHNLQDSGRKVVIALREGSPSRETVEQEGLPLVTLETFYSRIPLRVALLTPDATHWDVLQGLKEKLPAQTQILFAHGHSFVRYNLEDKFPAWEHLLLAPKAIASELRGRYLQKGALGAVYDIRGAVENAKQTEEDLLQLANDLGITFGPAKASFEEETKADLFSEQSLLCSLIPYGAKLSYEKLVDKGVSPELAYLECWFEIKLIVDTLLEKGPKEFFNMISPSAFIGGQKATRLFFDESFQKKLDQLYDDIESGRFDEEISRCELKQLRERVVKEWNASPLTRAHEKWGGELFGRKS